MLRRATEEDVGAVAEVYLRAFRGLTFLPIVHDDEETLSWVQSTLVPEHEVWVAEEDGAVVGFAALTPDSLAQIHVHPDAQSRGIGTQLIDKAKELRPNGLQLWVFQENRGARRFYERNGFRCVELTDGAGNEERAPDARYEWP